MWVKPDTGYGDYVNLAQAVCLTVRLGRYGTDEDRYAIYACFSADRAVTEENSIAIWELAIHPEYKEETRKSCYTVIDDLMEQMQRGMQFFDIATLRDYARAWPCPDPD